jgi:hypothetical protein
MERQKGVPKDALLPIIHEPAQLNSKIQGSAEMKKPATILPFHFCLLPFALPSH